MVAFCSSTAEGNECDELRKQYLPRFLGKPESGGTSILILNLYYDGMKIRPAQGNGDSSIKLVLRLNENRADSRKPMWHCSTHMSWRYPSVKCKQIP